MPSLSASALLSAAVFAQLAGATTTTKPPAFLLVGDSTTAVQSFEGGGYGTGFLSFLRTPAAQGINYGQDGATTASYRAGVLQNSVLDQGNWTVLQSALAAAVDDFEVFVPIMFGANDQKAKWNITLDMYQENLQNFALEVKEAGGTPILLTPMTRRKFSDEHTLKQDLIDQRTYTTYAAGNTSTKLLDFNLACENYLEAIGNKSSRAYDLVAGDQTHLNSWGSVVFGRLLADLLLGHSTTVGEDVDFVPDPTNYFTQYFVPNETLSQQIWGGIAA